ncbi:unnamed protein product, partial [Linum tenue]
VRDRPFPGESETTVSFPPKEPIGAQRKRQCCKKGKIRAEVSYSRKKRTNPNPEKPSHPLSSRFRSSITLNQVGMAGGGSIKSNPTKARKRVEADNGASAASMVRARDGSAFTRCEECKKDVAVALIGMHSCSLDAKIKMNLEAQVLENAADVKTTKKKAVERNTGEVEDPKAKRAKKEKRAAKDPNKPKRPPTAFFIFIGAFRKEYKEANPDSRDVKKIAKEAGEKWKSMTDEEKKPYLDKAAQLKAEHGKTSGDSNDAENGAAADKEGEDDDEEDTKEEEEDPNKEDAAKDGVEDESGSE